MKYATLFLALVLSLLVHDKRAAAEAILFDISTDQTTYVQGDMVHWSIDVNILNSTAENFGIASMSMNLNDSLGETLVPGVVPATGPFSGYLTSGGTPSGSGLIAIGGVLTSQDASVTVPGVGTFKLVRGADDANEAAPSNQRSDLRLAEGSFMATRVGEHSLVGSLPSEASNFLFTAAGQQVGAGREYAPISFNNASFTVTAIPEPSSALLFFAAMALGGCCRSRVGRR
ncbi:MAG: hypothetical protein KDA45_02455 [Planctomycetales bacterium]|nr:hypothetical protein [Planctomycetales bacterium]